MKREGRQHGMVRAYPNLSLPSDPRPRRKMMIESISTPTASLFTRVPTKPTNHSKYTSRCGRPRCPGCHRHPVCKSIDKVKGAHKIRSTMDGTLGLKFYGFSASGVLDYLDRVDHHDCDDDEEEVDVLHASCDSSSLVFEIHEEVGDVDVLQTSSHSSSLVLEIEEVAADDDDDGMGFCEVGLAWEPVDGDESWCLIHEM